MVRPVGFEPTTYRFEVWRSIQLSYGRLFVSIIILIYSVQKKVRLANKKDHLTTLFSNDTLEIKSFYFGRIVNGY